MAKLLGIDIGGESVRVVLVRSSYRKFAVEGIGECELSAAPTLGDAIVLAASQLVAPGESIAVAVDGERLFVRSLTLPPTALKQLGEVLPFELEANLPIELDDIVFDHALRRRPTGEGALDVIAVAARTDDVRERIDLIRGALGVEPEKVGAGGFPLASLVTIMPELAAGGPIGILEIGERRSELVILEQGEPVFARTLGRGTQGLSESATPLSRELRQTLSAWRASGGAAITRIHLAGPGSSLPGIDAYLQSELAIEVAQLPTPQLEPTSEEQLASLPRYAKALGLALSLGSRAKTMNLRTGPLAYERGYGFLRDKIPVLSGLAVVVVASFFFSAWAEMRSLGRDREVLEQALTQLSREVLGEATSDPERVTELLARGPGAADEDPLPYVDAFDVMVQISKAVPDAMAHDIEELDVQRGKVTIHGIVPTIPDAQEIAQALRSYRCFQDVKIVRTNQAVGDTRQKYVLELELKCPNGKKDEKKSNDSGSSEGAKP